MRIRKRQVPFPLSSLSPVPLSDPHTFSRLPAVQLQIPSAPPNNESIGEGRSDGAAANYKQKSNSMVALLKEDGSSSTSHDFRNNNGSSSVAEARAPKSDSSVIKGVQVVGRWGEGERSFPMKNRKHEEDEEIDDDDQKINKKRKEMKDGVKKRGGEIMEGSRCSRVNGRGWRCCQQTLVGYSLCEHHLGKGRLRSIVSVRNRATTTTTTTNNVPELASLSVPATIPTDDGSSKKRLKKLGVVKARSLSSLLSEKNNVVGVVSCYDIGNNERSATGIIDIVD